MKRRLGVLLLALTILMSNMSVAFAWRCTACGSDMDSNFCTMCGAPKPENVCPGCGQKFGEKTYAFCPSCGMKQGAEQTTPASGSKAQTEYDYCGVVYPEGNLGGETTFLFNNEDIGLVLFRGYEDEERKVFLRNLNEYYTAVREGREPVRQQ